MTNLKLWLLSLSILHAGNLFAETPNFEPDNLYPTTESRKKSAGETSYFIDSRKGNDTHSGRSKSSAWKTFSSVNQITFSPGDKIYISPGTYNISLMPHALGTSEKPVKIIFGKGIYHFESKNLIRRKYHISNTNDMPYEAKAIAILIDRSQHLQLISEDALFFMHGKMIEVCLDNALNISFEGLRFDYNRPTISEYKVVNVTDSYADLKIHKDSKFQVKNEHVQWIGDGWYHGQSRYGQLYDPINETLRRTGNPLAKVRRVEQLDKNNLVRAYFKDKNPGFRNGVIMQTRHTRRDCVGIFQKRSKNISWKNCSFHYLHGMGVISQFSENISFKNIVIAPRDESGRTCAAWADMLHFSGCRGLIDVDNVFFSGANDDAINIHGTHLRITERISTRKVKVAFMHRQTYGFDGFRAGDKVDFIRIKTMSPYASNKVVKVERLNDRESILTLEKDTPENIEPLDALENTTWTADLHVRNSIVKYIPTRGFLVTTRGKVVIENNTFIKTGMPAILVESDARGWYESGVVRDMTIRNNHFVHCRENVITIDPKVRSTEEPTHKNIRIFGNHFYLKNGRGILHSKNSDGITVEQNKIYVTADKKKEAEHYVHLEATRNAKIQSNKIIEVDDTLKASKNASPPLLQNLPEYP